MTTRPPLTDAQAAALKSLLMNFVNEFTDRDQDGQLCCTVYPDKHTVANLNTLRRLANTL